MLKPRNEAPVQLPLILFVYFRTSNLLAVITLGVTAYLHFHGNTSAASFLALAFGILLTNVGAEFLFSRTPLKHKDDSDIPVGAAMWKAGLLAFVVLGTTTIHFGFGPTLARYSPDGQHMLTMGLGLLCVALAAAILATEKSVPAAMDVQAVLDAADTYISYGRTAQAESTLKTALAANPGNRALRLKLSALQARTHS